MVKSVRINFILWLGSYKTGLDLKNDSFGGKMKNLIFIALLIVGGSAQAQSEEVVENPFSHEISVFGKNLQQLEAKAGMMGGSICASMFFGFGEVVALDLIEVQSGHSCDLDENLDCEAGVIADFKVSCALNLPDFDSEHE